jgi:hypothetical protein
VGLNRGIQGSAESVTTDEKFGAKNDSKCVADGVEPSRFSRGTCKKPVVAMFQLIVAAINSLRPPTCTQDLCHSGGLRPRRIRP